MPEGQSTRVVIADDENHIRTLISTVVRTLGFEIVGEAGNGKEAIDLFKEHQPDLTLLDINMPQMTGVEALEAIMDIDPDSCVIMLTSISDMGTVEDCISMGAANYIRKDTPLPEMKTMITNTWTDFNDD